MMKRDRNNLRALSASSLIAYSLLLSALLTGCENRVSSHGLKPGAWQITITELTTASELDAPDGRAIEEEPRSYLQCVSGTWQEAEVFRAIPESDTICKRQIRFQENPRRIAESDCDTGGGRVSHATGEFNVINDHDYIETTHGLRKNSGPLFSFSTKVAVTITKTGKYLGPDCKALGANSPWDPTALAFSWQ